MKMNKLLIATVLAIAIAAPMAAFVGNISMAQPTTSTGERTAFQFEIEFLDPGVEAFCFTFG